MKSDIVWMKVAKFVTEMKPVTRCQKHPSLHCSRSQYAAKDEYGPGRRSVDDLDSQSAESFLSSLLKIIFYELIMIRSN